MKSSTFAHVECDMKGLMTFNWRAITWESKLQELLSLLQLNKKNSRSQHLKNAIVILLVGDTCGHF